MSFWRFVGGFAIFSRVWDLILGSRKRRLAVGKCGNNVAYRADYRDEHGDDWRDDYD